MGGNGQPSCRLWAHRPSSVSYTVLVSPTHPSEFDAARDALEKSVLFVPFDDRGTFVIRGRDRLEWVSGLVTCEVVSAKPGDVRYGFLSRKNGKVITDVWISVGEADVLLSVRAETMDELEGHFEKHILMEDVEVSRSEPLLWCAVHGPGTATLLESEARHLERSGILDQTGRGGGILAYRTPDFDPAEAATRLGGILASPEAWLACRVEQALASFGEDFSSENYPQESSLERLAVSFSKGCYLGQEAVFMLEKRGHVSKRIVGLKADTLLTDCAPGSRVLDDKGTDVGRVTSVTPAPRTGHVQALALIAYRAAKANTGVSVGGTQAAVVVPRTASDGA